MAEIYLRRAQLTDLDDMMDIIDQAKAHLKAVGSPQWQDGHPNRQMLTEDVTRQIAWVLMNGNQIAGTASLQLTPEPSYQVIHQGQWAQPNAPYATIHRIAINDQFRGQGMGKILFSNLITVGVMQDLKNFRFDTHQVNKPMQALGQQFNFIQRGIVMVNDQIDRKRLAFELNLGGNHQFTHINNDFMQGLIK